MVLASTQMDLLRLTENSATSREIFDTKFPFLFKTLIVFSEVEVKFFVFEVELFFFDVISRLFLI